MIGDTMKNKYESIIDRIIKRNRISRFISMLIGTFIVAVMYNSFIVPNSVTYGGVGGIAIIINKFTGLDTTTTINVLTIVLVLISIVLLGLKNTSYAIIGFGSYTIMVNITAPFAHIFQIPFESYLFSIMVHACLAGVGFGLVYKAGFNTGGMDSVIAISQKYFKFPTARLSNIANGIIILVGALTFGVTASIYAIIYLKCMNFFSDRVILGTSTAKLCFIKSRHLADIEHLLTHDLEVGYTLIESTNGIGILKKVVVMCVIPTDRFYDLKRELVKIDKKMEIISNDCYTVINGKTNKIVNV